MEKAKKITVGVIQIDQSLSDREKFFETVDCVINEAVSNGAELVILPELFSTGYIPDYKLWDKISQEGNSGKKWLMKTSKKYGIYLAMGHAEIIDRSIFNTYLLTNPKGEIEGKSIKENGEAYIFQRGKGRHFIHSSLGLISIGICADNHFTKILKKIKTADPLIHIMPHAWPTPVETGKMVTPADYEKGLSELTAFPVSVAKVLGIPCIFANQVGDFPRMPGILGKFMSPEVFRLQGHSKIINGHGEILASMNSENGFILAEVALRKNTSDNYIPNYGGWTHKGSRILRNIIIPLDIFLGKMKYKIKLMKFLKKYNKNYET